MTTYPAGDLLLVAFPFVSGTQSKVRPGLVILDSGDADVLVARTTSHAPRTLYEISLSDWRGAGLLLPSTIRLHKLVTLDKTKVRRWLGSVQPPDRQRIADVLRQMFINW